MRLLAHRKEPHAQTRRTVAQARIPDHRPVRRRESGTRARGDTRGDRARRGTRIRQRLAALPPPAARHLVPGRDHGGGQPAHVAHRTRHRRHPARAGEPVPTGRGPGHRRHPVRRPDQPGRIGGHANALRPLQGGAVSRHPRRRGLLQGAGAATPARSSRRTGQRLRGHRRHRAVHRPHPAAFARAGRQGLVRRRHDIGEVGGRAGHQLPDQLRGQHRGHPSPRRLRHHPGPEHRRLSRQPSAPRKGPCVTGFGRHPHRHRDRRADPSIPRVRGEPVRADQGPAGSARHVVLPRLRRHAPTNWPTSCTTTPVSSAPTKWPSPCRSPSTRTTTGRSSPTSPRVSGPGSDGSPRTRPPPIGGSPPPGRVLPSQSWRTTRTSPTASGH